MAGSISVDMKGSFCGNKNKQWFSFSRDCNENSPAKVYRWSPLYLTHWTFKSNKAPDTWGDFKNSFFSFGFSREPKVPLSTYLKSTFSESVADYNIFMLILKDPSSRNIVCSPPHCGLPPSLSVTLIVQSVGMLDSETYIVYTSNTASRNWVCYSEGFSFFPLVK